VLWYLPSLCVGERRTAGPSATLGMTRGRTVTFIRSRQIGWTEKKQVPALCSGPTAGGTGGMTKGEGRQVLWYPTQAPRHAGAGKTGLEWGTQRSAAGWENRRSLGFARDDKGECGASSGSTLVG
jgi:hypothetical protein